MNMDTRGAAKVAIAIAAVYFFLVELALLWPTGAAGGPEKLGSQDIIALASGTLTAAGLSALWLQLDAAGKASREASRLEAERSAAAALRFDELHMEFNTPEIRVMRDLGWLYLKFLTADGTRLETFARWWVLSEGKAPLPPAKMLREADLAHLEPKRRADYTWALSTMVAFFVRIENRLNAHYGNKPIDQETLRVSVGPFFWEYWEPYLLPMATACDEVFKKEAAGRFEPPYFSVALRKLDGRFPKRAKVHVVEQKPPRPARAGKTRQTKAATDARATYNSPRTTNEGR